LSQLISSVLSILNLLPHPSNDYDVHGAPACRYTIMTSWFMWLRLLVFSSNLSILFSFTAIFLDSACLFLVFLGTAMVALPAVCFPRLSSQSCPQMTPCRTYSCTPSRRSSQTWRAGSWWRRGRRFQWSAFHCELLVNFVFNPSFTLLHFRVHD
jgi:hypothetical protein